MMLDEPTKGIALAGGGLAASAVSKAAISLSKAAALESRGATHPMRMAMIAGMSWRTFMVNIGMPYHEDFGCA